MGHAAHALIGQKGWGGPDPAKKCLEDEHAQLQSGLKKANFKRGGGYVHIYVGILKHAGYHGLHLSSCQFRWS